MLTYDVNVINLNNHMLAYNINNHATNLCIYESLNKVIQLVRLCVSHFFTDECS